MSPRSQLQNEQIRSESTRKILHAAFNLMALNGYESTSIAQIAKEAGISKGLMYNYFDSKEELLKALVNHAFSEGEKVMAKITDDDPKETLRNIFRWFFDELRFRMPQWRLITELTFKIEKLAFVKDIAKSKLFEFIKFISSLLEQMNFENPKQEAQVIAGLLDGIGFQCLVMGEDYHIDEMEVFLIDKYCNNKKR